MSTLSPDPLETRELLDRIEAGDPGACNELFHRHRNELKRFIEFHLDARLRQRFDPSDIVQETQLELHRRITKFVALRPMPFHLWQRKKAYERLLNLRRDHVKRARRSVTREIRVPDRSSIVLAAHLLDKSASPSDILQSLEREAGVRRAVERLSLPDREILLLRHADDLQFDEIACLVGIASTAARKRFGRALIRLQKLLEDEGLFDATLS